MVTFFKQRETYRLDKARLSEYFGLCPFIGFSQNNADKSSSKASSKGSNKRKKLSRSTKSSSSSKSSRKLNLLQEKAKIAELEAEATFLLEKQKAENQTKILQIQGEVARAKAKARVYEDYNQMETNSEVD